MMTKIKRFLLDPIVTILLAVVLIALAVWFVGDLLAFGEWRPFEGTTRKLLIIGGLLAVWALAAAFIWWRRRRKARALTEEIVEQPRDMAAEAVDEEQRLIEARFAEAMKSLARLRFRNRFGGKRYLYELPWYVFIGPPASGKTTALYQCGLEFPLARGEDIAIKGAAGTRSCEWVFANDAVFIDTAGRWATQDSHERVDAAAWSGFLKMLERTRPEEPLNGVIVAISIGDLAVADAATIDRDAELMRQRLLEICDALDVTIPVYVMFTKCDLVVGFTEFFQTMSPEERAQVWGVTFPHDPAAAPLEAVRAHLGMVEGEFDALIDRAGERVLGRLDAEQDVSQRARIFEFPAQFSSLKTVVNRFLNGVFQPDRFTRPLLFRGFYFTSATQQGQPVDRLISRMASNFGLGGRIISMLSGTGRAYFLRNLLTDVIFPEAGLVKHQGRGRTVARVAKWAGLAACLLLPVVLGVGWSAVRAHNAEQAEALTAAFAAYEQSLPVELDPVSEEDLRPILPALDTLRAEVARISSDEADPPLWGLGIDDTDTLREQAEAAYRQGLERLLRPRLFFHLERLIEESLHDQDALYDNLKTYLMLGGRGVRNETWLRQYFTELWKTEYEGIDNRDVREALQPHLAELVRQDMPPALQVEGESSTGLNEDTIARARDALDISIAERALILMRRSEEAVALPPWRLTDVSRTAQDVFVRRDGLPLDTPIPGLFTYDGFWSFVIHNVDSAADLALSEKWLVEDDAEPTDEELKKIRRELLGHYYDEYIRQWNSMLENLRFTAVASPEQAAEVLNFLSSNRSPLRRTLEAVVRETNLDEQPPEDSALRERVIRMSEHQLLQSARRLGSLGLAAADDFSASLDGTEGKPVEEAFAELHDFVGLAQRSELGDVMDALDELYDVAQDLVDRRGEVLAVLSTTQAASRLSQSAKRAPLGVADMLDNLLEQVSAATGPEIQGGLNSIWKASIYPQCRTTIHGNYPFGDGGEVPVADLERLLGPGGELETFFNERVRPMVDTSVSPWAWKPNVAGTIGIPPERLAFFEDAEEIRRALFPRNSPAIGMLIQVFPVAIDDKAEVGRFGVGGATVSFTPAERTPGQVQWPGPQPANGARVAVEVNDAFFGADTQAEEHVLEEPGVWGLFKLLDATGLRRRGAGERMGAKFVVGGRTIYLDLRFESATNPFALRKKIAAFRCPASL